MRGQWSGTLYNFHPRSPGSLKPQKRSQDRISSPAEYFQMQIGEEYRKPGDVERHIQEPRRVVRGRNRVELTNLSRRQTIQRPLGVT